MTLLVHVLFTMMYIVIPYCFIVATEREHLSQVKEEVDTIGG